MRHGVKLNHLGRKTAHRKAMLANMGSSLIKMKRITTTLAKAKALRVYIEPLLTKSKDNTTHSRRTVFSYLRDKDAVTKLFGEVAEKIATRPGGYTRIMKLGVRHGDASDMAMIELVDFFGGSVGEVPATAEKKKRTRRGAAKKTAEAKTEDAPKKKVTRKKPAKDEGETPTE